MYYKFDEFYNIVLKAGFCFVVLVSIFFLGGLWRWQRPAACSQPGPAGGRVEELHIWRTCGLPAVESDQADCVLRARCRFKPVHMGPVAK